MDNKINISKGEANETLFWLEVREDLQWVSLQQIEKIFDEAKQLLAILSSISYSNQAKIF